MVPFLLGQYYFHEANGAMQIGKKHIGFFILVILFSCLLAFNGCSSLKSENQKLKEKITEINTENEKLKKDLSALKGENSEMHGRLSQLTQQISGLQQEIQTLQKDLDVIKTQVGGKKGKKS